MKELLSFLAKSLVENPDAVTVKEAGEKEGSIVLELYVDPADMGRVIGKQGKIAKAIRIVVKSAAMRDGKKVIVDIVG